jgi:transcriptional regulator GlxA family with amidase domain
MANGDNRLTVALLAVPEITASTLYGMFDLFAGAGRDWAVLVHGVPGAPRFHPSVVSVDKHGFSAANDVWIKPDASLDECRAPHVVCIPEVFIAPEESLKGRYRTEIEWIQRCYASGATIATACSGAMLLAETGLLDGQEATTHWGYCDVLARRYPKIRVLPSRSLVVSGHEQRFVMAGGGTSWQDLALFLIARFIGADEAMHLAKIYLIDWHDIGQQPFATLTRTRHVEDALIGKCQVWIAEHYDQDAPVAAMVKLSGLADRSFKRRFQKATGMTPIEYVHTLRLEESKQVLETTDLSIEAVANEVGYEDASFFGRLFRRKVGLTPAQYRKRFGGLRKALGKELPTALSS